eukprot:4072799-Pyramimonas_sp.AAC.1
MPPSLTRLVRLDCAGGAAGGGGGALHAAAVATRGEAAGGHGSRGANVYPRGEPCAWGHAPP